MRAAEVIDIDVNDDDSADGKGDNSFASNQSTTNSTPEHDNSSNDSIPGGVASK